MNVFAGFNYELAVDWRARVEPPVKPANWKEDTWKDKIEEAWLKKADPTNVLSGRVETTYSYDPVTDKTKAGNAAGFIAGLVEASTKFAPVTLYGFGTFDALRLCLWECVAQNRFVAPWLWSSFEDRTHIQPDRLKIIDLYMLCGAKGADVPLFKWLDLWDVSATKQVRRAEPTAKAAWEVAVKMGFVEA